jgi:hypothetical protein
MAFDVKMSSEVARSLTRSSGKVQSSMSSPASISQLGAYDELVAEAVDQADEKDIRDRGS